MDKNLLGMYDLKIERLKKALERNNMTCEVFKKNFMIILRQFSRIKR